MRPRGGYSVQVARLMELAAQGVRTQQIAAKLGITREWVWRLARRHDIQLPDRPARVRGKLEWQRLYDQHGPGVCAMARAIGMNRTYVARMLHEYGIRTQDKWAEAQEEEWVA